MIDEWKLTNIIREAALAANNDIHDDTRFFMKNRKRDIVEMNLKRQKILIDLIMDETTAYLLASHIAKAVKDVDDS